MIFFYFTSFITLTMEVCRRSKISFGIQISIICIVIIAAVINISLNTGNKDLWVMLISSCLGYILPNPKLKVVKENNNNNES